MQEFVGLLSTSRLKAKEGLRDWRNSAPRKALDFSGCKSRPGTGSLHPAGRSLSQETHPTRGPSSERNRPVFNNDSQDDFWNLPHIVQKECENAK
jgi:hypothetical protein